MSFALRFIRKLARAIFCNPHRPVYIRPLFIFARTYVGFYNGEATPDGETNGEFRVLSGILKRPSEGRPRVIFDVGANIGLFTERAIGLDPSVFVHCFEPDPNCLSLLSAKVAQNGRIILNDFALGEKEEERTFYLQDRPVLNSLHKPDAVSGRPAVLVRVRRLDEYCTKRAIRHIDFLKIDTEGHDLFVLKGASALLEHAAIDFIQFEIARESIDARIFLKDFVTLCAPYHYEIFRIRPQSLLRLEYTPAEESFTYMNFLAVSPNIDRQFLAAVINH